jgi:cell division topological specificity factor
MLGFLRRPRQGGSADAAKDRLQILLSHERAGRTSPEFLPTLQREILEVVKRHMKVDAETVDIRIDRGDDLSTLEINVELPGSRSLEKVESAG